MFQVPSAIFAFGATNSKNKPVHRNYLWVRKNCSHSNPSPLPPPAPPLPSHSTSSPATDVATALPLFASPAHRVRCPRHHLGPIPDQLAWAGLTIPSLQVPAGEAKHLPAGSSRHPTRVICRPDEMITNRTLLFSN